MFAKGFHDNKEAFDFETKIKGWSRKKKEALFVNDWDRIHEFAKCKNESSHVLHEKKMD